MKILTFDTSLDKMYVTVSHNGAILTSKTVSNIDGKYHSAFLISTIAEILKKNSLTMPDIHAIGVNTGPGSFTGIRAGVTAARIFGQNLNIPCVGISSLEIISGINTTDKNTLCLLDARKNMAYAAIYGKDSILLEPQAIELEKIPEMLSRQDYFIITDAKINKYLTEKGVQSLDYTSQEYDFGKILSEITYKRLKHINQENFYWSMLKPLYIQPPPITMPKTAKI
jgi:tRNA threonylcarbamoyl adenosine modification protein YeaZ